MIPIIDLSHYVRGTSQERERFVRTFSDGLKEFGFVTLENHGIDAGMINRTYADAQALFRRPREEKERYRVPNGGGQRGYTGFGQEHAKNRAVGDLKEFWHVGRDLPVDHPRRAAYGENVWPDDLPSFKTHTLALFSALDEVASTLLRALAESFGVAPTTFSDMAKDGNSILRIIHYPPLKEAYVPGAVRASEHEDINLITLLCEGTASGLEILTRQGRWVPVDTLRGQIVVDSGDMLSRVTNGVIPATTHRVVNPEGDDVARYSMPFFVHPYPDCVLAPLEVTQTPDSPSRFPPITADAFLRERLREIGLL